ncbi:PREDICTED: leucine-rich repeat-containing protein 27 isoform X1 [Poecilia mexicana]|uniref:leucine-rich repeat-containing protein 27 isoform X1 n=1 Tax=Poecilia mexicana TaxID=48701 RepID=UPI00072DE227|nr:PREDICTED: leucine-rich repeat-containing protein 27 isoform X1 [Poecilia mexicana]
MPQEKMMFETELVQNDLNWTSSMAVFDKDIQGRFVFGDNDMNLERKFSLPEKTEPEDEPTPTDTLSLKGSNLTYVPDSVLKNSLLTRLCLQENRISSISGSLFSSLPQLQWLDLRKNLITSLPVEIGSHRCLTHLLLEANPITELPAELGNVITLRGLSLRDCPIHFPAKEVLQQGCYTILQHLRTVLAEREVSERRSLAAENELQLVKLPDSSVDGSADEDGLLRFKELKYELMLLEKAEMSLVPYTSRRSPLHPLDERKASSTQVVPELQVSGSQYGKKAEAAARREKERREASLKLHKQAKGKAKQKKRQEVDSKWHLEGPSQEPKLCLSTEREEDRFDLSGTCRSARELERNIRTRVKRLQERHRNTRSTVNQEMSATLEDVAEIRRLQARLLERKGQRRNFENPFSPDSWPRLLFK